MIFTGVGEVIQEAIDDYLSQPILFSICILWGLRSLKGLRSKME